MTELHRLLDSGATVIAVFLAAMLIGGPLLLALGRRAGR